MDALRKAEEEKKKAEQETEQGAESTAAETPPAETAAPAQEQGVEPAVDVPPVEPESELADADSETVEEPAATDLQQLESPIPDVTLEFDESDVEGQIGIEEAPVAASEESPDATETSSDSLSGIDADSLSLEPIDRSLSGLTRQPFDDDVTPDYSAESPLVALTRQTTESSASSDQSTVYPPAKPQAKTEPSTEPKSAPTQEATPADLPEYVPQPPDAPEPVTEPEPKPTAKPDLKLTPKRSTLSERSEPERRAARSMFAAKRKGGGKRRFRMRRSQRIWLLQIAAGLVVLVGASYYFFFLDAGGNDFNIPEEFVANQSSYSEQFNQSIDETDTVLALDSFVETPVEPQQLAPQENVVAELESPLDQLVSEVTVAETVEVPVVVETPVDAAAATVVTELAETEQPVASEVAVGPAESATNTALESALDATPAVEQQPVNLISFTRRETPTGIDPDLQRAYQAFQRDDLTAAQALYQQVLVESPRQRDALLGLAAIAVRNGEAALAMELYSRLLARDPSDSVAQAGLLGIIPGGSAEQQERALRRLIEQQPEVAPVIYALGNFYAAQGRWNEAQRSYFDALQQAKSDALQGVPVNPDYAFNLAVSLERLNQVSPAQTYYREAIAYAENAPASFDLSIARGRLSMLSGNSSQ